MSKKQTAVQELSTDIDLIIERVQNEPKFSESIKAVVFATLKTFKNHNIKQALELEKERESHFSEPLKGSTQFLEKVISEGLVDNNPLLKVFIEGQIASNNLTLETYGNKKSN